MAIKLSHSYSALKNFSTCPKRYHHERIAKDVVVEQGEAAMWGEQVHTMLEHRLRDKTPLPADKAQWEALCRAFEKIPGELFAEQEMTLNKDLTPTGWWDSDAWLRSKVDVLVLNGADAVVADWKTGKHRPDFDQLELFAIQTFKHYPDVHRVTTSFVWLKDMLPLDTKVYTRLDAPALWSKLMSKITRVEQALEHDVWPANPSGLCPWCPAYKMCEYAK